jgi:3-mercaptopyruvate sulfurtransferase SseA
VQPGDRIITYCRTGGQAGHLHFVARMLGFDVRFYDGSFVEWSRNPERPVVGPDGVVAPAFTAR